MWNCHVLASFSVTRCSKPCKFLSPPNRQTRAGTTNATEKNEENTRKLNATKLRQFVLLWHIVSVELDIGSSRGAARFGASSFVVNKVSPRQLFFFSDLRNRANDEESEAISLVSLLFPPPSWRLLVVSGWQLRLAELLFPRPPWAGVCMPRNKDDVGDAMSGLPPLPRQSDRGGR